MTHKVFPVRLTLLESGGGGRSSPMRHGYRSLFRFDGHPDLFGVELTMANDVEPGQTADVEARVWAGDHLPDLQTGQAVELLEGRRVVGRGVLTSAPASDIARR